MSVKIITRVFEHSKTKGGDRLLMVCIADQAGEEGIAFPGIKNICERMGGVTERSVKLQFKRIMPTHELLIYPRTRQSHNFIVAVGMSSQELKRAIRKLAHIRKTSTLELAKVRRARAGKPTGEGEKDSPSRVKKDHPGGESAITQGVNPDSPIWITSEADGDPRSVMIRQMIQPPAAGAARGAAESGESDVQNHDAIMQAVIVGSFNQSADAALDEHGEYLLSRITNWLGVNFPDDSADDVRGFYRWYTEKTKGEYAAPRELRKFSMQYREYKASLDGTAPKSASNAPALRLSLRADDPRLVSMTPEQLAQIDIMDVPMTLEERRSSAEQMQRMLNGER